MKLKHFIFVFLAMLSFAFSGFAQSTVSSQADLETALRNGGEVFLGGNITVSSPVTIPNGAEVVLNLNGKTLKATNAKTKVLENQGKLTINGQGTVSGIIYNGTANGSAAEMILNGGTYSLDGNSGGLHHYGKTLTINDGVVVKTTSYGVRMAGKGSVLNLKGGTYTSTGSGDMARPLALSNGTVNFLDSDITVNGYMHVMVGQVTVNFGENNQYSPFEAYHQGNSYASSVFYCKTLAEAISCTGFAAVTLVKNVKVAADAPITINKEISLNLNGKNLSATNAKTIVLKNYANLTIKGKGTVTGLVYNGDADNKGVAEMTLNGGTYKLDGANGGFFNYGKTLTVNDGVTISSQVYGLRMSNAASVINLNGGTFTSTNPTDNMKRAIAVDAGTINFNDDDITINGYLHANRSKAKVNFGEYCPFDAFMYSTTNASGYYVVNLENAIDKADAGYEIVLQKNIERSEIVTLPKKVTLDGNGKTLTSTAGRAINVDCADVVTIENLTIAGATGCERGINIINKAGTTNLKKVNVSGVSYYAVHVATSAGAAQVNIENSNLTGWAAVAAYGDGGTINVKNSNLVGIGNATDNTSNDFATIAAASNITVNVTGGKVTAERKEGKAPQAIVCGNSTPTTGVKFVLDTELELKGTAEYANIDLDNNTVTVREEYGTNYVTTPAGNGLVTLTGASEAMIGDKKYSTIAQAFAAAKEGETITLIADVAPMLVSQSAITKAAVIDLNGKRLTLNNADLYFGTTTFKNGTIVVAPSVNASTAVFWMFENQALTFDNVDIVATGVTGTYLIGINGGTGTTVDIINGSSITIDNESKANLTAVICDNGTGNTVTIKDSDIDVKNIEGRFYLGGKNGAVVVENTDADLNGVKEGFYLRAGQSLDIAGTSNVNVVLNSTEGRYGINVTDATAKYNKAETAEVNATVFEKKGGNNFNGYVGTDGIWGEVWGNAKESFVIKVLDASGNVMGTTSLNNVGGIIDGDVTVSWNLKFDAASNTDEYWTMEWTTAPSISNMPARVALCVDGVDVSGGPVVLNGPDDLNKIVAAVTDADGKILSCHISVANAAATNATNIALLRNTTEEIILPVGVKLNTNGFTAANVKTAVAVIGTQKFASLQGAIDAVKNGDTITLIADVAENVTVVQAPDMAFTIDGNDKTMKGTITVDGKSAAYATAGLTIKNVNFDADGIAAEACINLGAKGDSNTRYTNGVTVDNCTFTGTDKAKAGIKNYTGGCKNVTITNSTATGMHSLAQFKTSYGVTLTKNTVTECKNGISVDGSTDVTITECTVDVNGYGIRANGGSDVTVTSNDVKAFTPVVVRSVTANSSFTFNGKNTMVASNEAHKWMVIGDEEYEAGKTLPAESTANVVVALNDANLFYTGIHGAGLAGEGTAEAPYLINNATELQMFRDKVNAGATKFSAPGVWVALNADIDLAGINWVGIGSMTADHGFMGNFDGKGFKIQNLTINNPALDSDGYAYAGLFALTEGTDKDNQNTIKNLTIENVTINTTGDIVSAAIAYAYYTIVDNVKVCGDIKINGGDYTAGVLAYTRRCVNASNLAVEGNEGSYIKGAQVVGGVISDIQMNGGLKAEYSNFSAKNIAVIGEQMVGGISGNIATQTLNGATVENVTLTSGDARVGTVAGCFGGTSTITDVTVNNVTGATVVIGATYNGAKAVEARIGDTYYETFAAAYTAAKAGETVTMLTDLNMSEILVLDKAITLDGGNCKLTSTAARAINVDGADGATIKNLTINASGERAINVINGATNVTIENVTATAANYTVNLAGSAVNAVVTINKSNLTGLNVVNVAAAGAQVTVDNTTLNCADNSEAEGYAALALNKDAKNGSIVATNITFNIEGDSRKASNQAEGGTITIEGSTDEVEQHVAYISYGNNWYGFATLEAAIAKANAGETVTLLRNITASAIITIDKAITLDGNGKTLTSTAGRAINVDCDGNVGIKNLTINAKGERAINVIQKPAKVTIENVTATAANYTVNLASSAGAAEVAISNSTLNGLCTVNVSAAGAKVTVDNSTVNCNDNNTTAGEAYAALCLNKEAVGGSIVATNTTVNVAAGSDSMKGRNSAENGTVTINGSTDGVAVMVAVITYEGSVYYHSFSSLAETVEFAKAGDVITLISDVTVAQPVVINKSVTLNGNGKTLTYTGADRAIEMPNVADANYDVTIKNLNVVATTANRGLNYNDNGKLNVEGVTVTIGENVDGYAINFPGMADGAQVTIKDSKLTSRNPLNIWGENMVINVYDSEIISVENSTTYDYAAIQLNNDNYANVANGTVVNVYGGTITALNEKGEPSNVVANASETGVVNISDETVITGKVLNYVANIDGAYFGSLQAAVNAIEKHGYNSPIVIMKDFATSEATTIKSGLKVTINLNGKTITGTDNATGSFGLITNKGDLTINGEGAITLVATNDRDWNAYSSVISNTVGGKLTVNGGTIQHLGGTDMAYAIDNLTNGKGTYAETIINGGAVKSTYRAVRQFLNGTEAQNILTVNGGTIEGTNKSIWMQDPSKNSNTGKLTVAAGAKLTGDVYLSVTAGSTEWPVEVAVDAAALQGESKVLDNGNVPAGYDLALVNGVYGVYSGAAKIGTTYYETIDAAIKAAKAGETVNILAGTYEVPAMKAGITVEGAVNADGTPAVLLEGTLSGTLDNLTLKNLHIKGGNAQRWAYAKGSLVFENVIFDATSVYAIHFDGIAAGTNLTYKNCTIIGWAAMGGTPESCVFDGCTIKGNGSYGLIRTYFDATIKDCTFDVANVNTTDAYEDGIHAVEGAKVTVTKCTNVNGDMEDLVNVHGASVVTVDGVAYKNVAKVGDNYYATLAEAFAAVGDGAGKTVELIANVDLAGAAWTPVTFNGVFDGKNHTISNLVVNGAGKSNQGFFAQTQNGEIKNVTFNNAKVTGRLNVGVVAGTPYTSKYTNVKVTGHVEVNGMAYVGGVGGKNAYADWTDITVDVDATSYVKATSTENGTAYRTYVGGVIGFNGEGGHTFKNISSNIKVIGDVMDIGGIFGILHYGNKAENITFTGAVEAPAGATQVGGIAGVWHNEKGQTVTINNATSTGTVTIGDVTTTGSLVGGAYNAKNQSPETSGSLIIDGKEAWVGVAKIGDKPYVTLAEAVDAAQAGETITLITDIQLTEAILITDGMDVTIAGEGKTITSADGQDAFYVKGGKLTLAEGLNVHATTDCAIYLRGGDVFTAANLTKSGDKYHVIQGNGSYTGNVTITGGKVEHKANKTAIYWPQNGKLTITGGEIIGHSAVYIASGSLEITGGTLHGVGETGSYEGVTGGSTDSPAEALTIENVGGNSGYELISSVVISGGTFISDHANAIGSYANTTLNPDATPVANFISGGTFSSAVLPEWCATDYAPVVNANGTYGVEPTVVDELTLVDGEFTEFVNQNDKTVGVFSYTRTFRNSGVWNAIYLPVAVPMSAIDLDKYEVAYINDVHSEDKNGDGEINLTDNEMWMEVVTITDNNATLKAYHPYVIKVKSDDDKAFNLTLKGVIVKKAEEVTYDCSSLYQQFNIQGTCRQRTKEELAGGLVVSAKGGWVTSTTAMNPFRLFMTITDRNGEPVEVVANESQAMRIKVRGEEDTTDIEGVEFNTNGEELIFDLQGRRVLEPKKGGIYIINGKKVYYNK